MNRRCERGRKPVESSVWWQKGRRAARDVCLLIADGRGRAARARAEPGWEGRAARAPHPRLELLARRASSRRAPRVSLSPPPPAASVCNMPKRAASASASPSRSPSRSASPEQAPGVAVAVDADDAAPAAPGAAAAARKRRRTLPYEALYLAGLPDASRYYKSLMHRDTLSFVTLTPHSHFLVTASADGHVKFWKKQEVGIEFVKHYKAHTAPVTAVACSADGALYASVGQDGSAKVFDVANFGA